MKTWAPFGALLLLCASCTITLKDKPDPGSTGGSGGAGSDAQTACGAVTEAGKCEGKELVYCSTDKLERLDCARVGAECVQGQERADCIVPSRTTSCGELTRLGSCDGPLLEFCDTSSVVLATPAQIDCAAYGQTCDPTAGGDGGAECVPVGSCPAGLDESGTCDGNSLRFCEGDHEYRFDCGADQCRTVGGFSDCFIPGTITGCDTETAAGRCEGEVLVNCRSEIVTREDCGAVGLTCVDGDTASCARVDCPAVCADGFACVEGKCELDATTSREWTVLVYMVGDNNLSDAAWRDLNEMELAGSNEAVQVVAQWELSEQYTSLAPIDYRSGVYRTPITHDENPDLVANLDESERVEATDMADPSAMADFIRWGVETYPAQRTAVIVWNHGFGWRGGFIDSGDGGTMTVHDLATGMRDAGVHLDLVAFDACLMAMHEVGLALRGVTDTLVASQEVEPGSGYPYDRVLARLHDAPEQNPSQLGTVIASEFTDHFNDGLRASSVTMSVLDLTTMSSSNDQLAAFSSAVITDLPVNRRGIADAVSASSILRFGEPESADLRSVLDTFSSLGGNIGPAAGSYMSWLDTSGAVTASLATRNVADATGLAIHLPRVAFSFYNSNSLQDYRDATSFLPLDPWHQVVSSLTGTGELPPRPTTGASSFNVRLAWADAPDGDHSDIDLDLYVYEPDGHFGTPANGSVTPNGLLSADSGASQVSAESYELRQSHAPGTYLVLVHLYKGAEGQEAYPTVIVERDDAEAQEFVRGKITDRQLEYYPMSDEAPLEAQVDNNNIDAVLSLEYSNIWYVTAIEAR